MAEKIILDVYEQDIEDCYDALKPIQNMQQEMVNLIGAAKLHIKRKKINSVCNNDRLNGLKFLGALFKTSQRISSYLKIFISSLQDKH